LNPDPLAQLHPLRTPDAVTWWPPAPGWWLLAAVVVLLLCCLALWLWRRQRRNRYRRRALEALAQLEQLEQSAATADPGTFAVQVNALLKHCAIQAFGNRPVASLSGLEWQDFLQRTLPGKSGTQFGFAAEHYSGREPDQPVPAIAASARTWIRRHRAAA